MSDPSTATVANLAKSSSSELLLLVGDITSTVGNNAEE